MAAAKLITSRDNVLAKRVKGLAQSSRERKKSGLALIEGAHLVAACIEKLGVPDTLIASESGMRRPEIAGLMAANAAHHAVFSDAVFQDASMVETPAGILALIRPPDARPVSARAKFCLLLEDIQDPGNLGALLRSAAAAGCADVLLSPTCAFAWAPKVLRAGQGAHFNLNIVEGADLGAFVHAYHGASLALTPRTETSLFTCDLTGPVALLIGNEGAGLSGHLLDSANIRAKLPMPGGFESLNAAAAGAIALFEVVRQRGTAGRKR
ncbi:MAG: RNA methyltransferase [Betaproteobacteria bacterium]|nr:RNA methyltransferase [Betaproteobacteria bacterium]